MNIILKVGVGGWRGIRGHLEQVLKMQCNPIWGNKKQYYFNMRNTGQIEDFKKKVGLRKFGDGNGKGYFVRRNKEYSLKDQR